MSTGTFVLLIANFAYIGVLPFVFFRRDGKLNLMWWLTASPLFASSGLIAMSYLGLLTPWYPPDMAFIWEGLAAFLAAVSVGLISFTLGTHNRRLALWHQDNDRPEHLVTQGAYKRIRHPFYSSFIAALVASAVVCASPWAVAISLIGVCVLNATAAREEKRLLASAFGTEYRQYLARSGRFFPSMKQVQP